MLARPSGARRGRIPARRRHPPVRSAAGPGRGACAPLSTVRSGSDSTGIGTTGSETTGFRLSAGSSSKDIGPKAEGAIPYSSAVGLASATTSGTVGVASGASGVGWSSDASPLGVGIVASGASVAGCAAAAGSSDAHGAASGASAAGVASAGAGGAAVAGSVGSVAGSASEATASTWTPTSAGGCPGTIVSDRTYLPGPTRIQVTGAESGAGSAADLATLRDRARLRRGLAMVAAAGSRRRSAGSPSSDSPAASPGYGPASGWGTDWPVPSARLSPEPRPGSALSIPVDPLLEPDTDGNVRRPRGAARIATTRSR